jgi:hypothetical protein
MTPVWWLVLVFGVLAVLGASGSAIRYRITPTHLEVNWLIFTLRRFRLQDIKYVSTKRSFWAEKWYNTWRVQNRRLTLHRRSGLFRVAAISPKNPFVFKAELDRAIEAANGSVAQPPTDLAPGPADLGGSSPTGVKL